MTDAGDTSEGDVIGRRPITIDPKLVNNIVVLETIKEGKTVHVRK